MEQSTKNHGVITKKVLRINRVVRKKDTQRERSGVMEVVIQVVAASLRLMKWRLRPPSIRRLQTGTFLSIFLCNSNSPYII